MLQVRWITAWRERARNLRDETAALYLAYRDPRVPWYARLYLACVLAYLFSPIDLIPDVIPLLGYADELLLMPFFIAIGRRLIPVDVLDESRARVATESRGNRPTMARGAVLVVLVWIVVTLVSAWLIWRVSPR